jgi:hypothetical protein
MTQHPETAPLFRWPRDVPNHLIAQISPHLQPRSKLDAAHANHGRCVPSPFLTISSDPAHLGIHETQGLHLDLLLNGLTVVVAYPGPDPCVYSSPPLPSAALADQSH